MTLHDSSDRNGEGMRAAALVRRKQLDQALEEAITAARRRAEDDLVAAMGGKDQVYPTPLTAGPQAYTDPSIWRGHETPGYKRVLELMALADEQQRRQRSER